MVRERGLIRAISSPTDQHESPIAIAAIDITLFVDLQPHTGVAERGRNTIMRAITADARSGDTGDFGWRDHEGCDSNRVGGQQARSAPIEPGRLNGGAFDVRYPFDWRVRHCAEQ